MQVLNLFFEENYRSAIKCSHSGFFAQGIFSGAYLSNLLSTPSELIMYDVGSQRIKVSAKN